MGIKWVRGPVLGLAAATLLFCTGCSSWTSTTTDASALMSGVMATSRADWKQADGNYIRSDNSVSDSGTLQLKALSGGKVLFDFHLRKQDTRTSKMVEQDVASVLTIGQDGVGVYQTRQKGKMISVSLRFNMDARSITVTHTGDMTMSCDGQYRLAGNELLPTRAFCSAALLDFLPEATTGLPRDASLKYLTIPAGSWFYRMQYLLSGTERVMATYLVARDLSAIYREDAGTQPMLLYGSAQPMLDAPADPKAGDESVELVSVALQSREAVLSKGQSNQLVALLPWRLPYTVTAKSSNPKVVSVSSDGVVTAMAPGKATLYGTLLVNDGKKTYTLDLTVK